MKAALLTVFLMFCPFLKAEGALTASAPHCKCEALPPDQFEEPQKFQFGRFAGLCIDSCRFRAAKILPGSKFGDVKAKRGEILVANLLHMEKYFVTAVPMNRFAKASVGFEEFFPGVYHVFLKFELEEVGPPLTLENQGAHSERAETRTLVISSEGVPPKGQKYSLVESYFDNYLFVHRLTTGEESERWISKLKNSVKFYDLKVSRKQVAQILGNAIEKSDRDQLQAKYRLFANNCATSAIDLIMSSFDVNARPKTPWLQIDKALPIAGPLSTLNFLGRIQLTSITNP